MKRLFAAAAVSFVCACTPMEWAKTDGSAADLQQDMRQCQQEAWRETTLESFHYFGNYGPFTYRDPFGRVMPWPYGPFYDPFGDRFMEQSRLANVCMRAKGYELAPLDKPTN